MEWRPSSQPPLRSFVMFDISVALLSDLGQAKVELPRVLIVPLADLYEKGFLKNVIVVLLYPVISVNALIRSIRGLGGR